MTAVRACPGMRTARPQPDSGPRTFVVPTRRRRFTHIGTSDRHTHDGTVVPYEIGSVFGCDQGELRDGCGRSTKNSAGASRKTAIGPGRAAKAHPTD